VRCSDRLWVVHVAGRQDRSRVLADATDATKHRVPDVPDVPDSAERAVRHDHDHHAANCSSHVDIDHGAFDDRSGRAAARFGIWLDPATSRLIHRPAWEGRRAVG